MANDGIKVQILKTEAKQAEDKTGHTFIHFGGDMKRRFQVLANRAGYNRKWNTFGVMLFEQALRLAEADYVAQTTFQPEPTEAPTEASPADTSESKS